MEAIGNKATTVATPKTAVDVLMNLVVRKVLISLAFRLNLTAFFGGLSTQQQCLLFFEKDHVLAG